jgi:hypothetical protein
MPADRDASGRSRHGFPSLVKFLRSLLGVEMVGRQRQHVFKGAPRCF